MPRDFEKVIPPRPQTHRLYVSEFTGVIVLMQMASIESALLCCTIRVGFHRVSPHMRHRAWYHPRDRKK